MRALGKGSFARRSPCNGRQRNDRILCHSLYARIGHDLYAVAPSAGYYLPPACPGAQAPCYMLPPALRAGAYAPRDVIPNQTRSGGQSPIGANLTRISDTIRVPEGRPLIAQRFIAGLVADRGRSPGGTADALVEDNFSRPYGNQIMDTPKPTDKLVGYYHCPSGTERLVFANASGRPRRRTG